MMQKTVEIIEAAKTAMLKDGLSAGYIKSLSYTWNSLLLYSYEKGVEFSEDLCWEFLSNQYGIRHEQNYLSLSGVDKRRKRAMLVLINTLKYGLRSGDKYQCCRFCALCVDDFNSFLEHRKKQNLSITTINKDIYGLNKLSLYLELSAAESVRRINSPNVIGFMKWLSAEGKVPMLREVAGTLRLLLKYLYHSNFLHEDLSEVVPKVKARKDLVPSVYSQDEIESMLKSIDRSGARGKRDYAMVLLAARYGIRASDICSLHFENIHWEENSIEFTTIKTGKNTVLPLSGEVGNAIIEYLKFGRPNTEDKHIFIRFQKPYKEIQPSNIHEIVTRAMRAAGVVIQPGKRHGPHALRASIATEMLKNNVPLPVISESLSHSNTDTTRIYLKVDIWHLKRLTLDVPPLKDVWMGGAPV
ncbi:MAG: tyrosine-type recombinase/integrase [Spirochaetales bacterium]|nr:tyrosine-type recombinase/integrase [Spirochaetales bacterium]